MAKSQSSESLELPLKNGAGVKSFTIGIGSRFDVPTVVMLCVSVITGYLVLPPLYSVVQTSLFTTKLTGEIDQFTLRYYEDLFRELVISNRSLIPDMPQAPRWYSWVSRLNCGIDSPVDRAKRHQLLIERCKKTSID